MAWNVVRVLTNQAAEGTGTPGAAAFVPIADVGNRTADFVEIRFKALTVTSTPTAFGYSVWRTVDGEVDCVARVSVTSAEFAAPVPYIFEVHGDAVAVVIDSFTGGTSPVLNGTVQVRRVTL